MNTKTSRLLPISILALLSLSTAATAWSQASEDTQKPLVPSYNSPPISGELIDLTKTTQGPDYQTHKSFFEFVEQDSGYAVQMNYEQGRGYPSLQFPIPSGGWNLEHFAGIQLVVTNTGDHKVRTGIRTDNPGDHKMEPWNTDMFYLAPGETKIVETVFGQQNGAPAYPLDPKNISRIQVFVENPKHDGSILVSELRGYGTADKRKGQVAYSKPEDRNIPAVLPDWLGKRPPVEGDWVMSLDENFDGNELDLSIWTPRLCWNGPAKGEIQRYIEENVYVEDGLMKIRCEYNPGHQYNDLKLDTREFATGAVTSLGKWTQRYGYIEARIKPPTARGLWPGFWTMPDRGKDTGLNIWQRRDTGSKYGQGMEIDIFEHLSEWGGGRYNIATHWDGYGSNHKQRGSTHTYYGPTPNGFHVAGILWEPGKLTWYLDGVKKGEWENDRIIDVPSYIKFTVQMGNWATKDVDLDALPDDFEIDYVRAWQLPEYMEKND